MKQEKEHEAPTRLTKRPTTLGRLAMRRLMRHRLAVVGLLVLIVLYLLAVFADFVAPYHYDDERRDLSHCPPTRLRLRDVQGRWHLRPFVYATRFTFDEYYRRVFVEDTSVRYPVKLLARGRAHNLLGLFTSTVHLFGVDEPARIYLLGADHRGRDLLSRILYGSRVSLSVGIVGVAISFLIGIILGGIAGYFGGICDDVIMRWCEMVMMVPGFYLLLALRASFPPGLPSWAAYMLIVVIMSFIGWAGLARIVRGMALSLSAREYVLSAKALGSRNLAIIFRHVFPNLLSYVIVASTLSVPGYILGESALSFLGLGIQDPHASWGNLLAGASDIAKVKLYPWMLLPGAFILLAVMAFNFLGDGLRDAFDPRMEVGKS